VGFAKFYEDLVSRHNADNRGWSRPRPNTGSPGRPLLNPPEKGNTTVSRLKEFTAPNARPLPVILLADISGSMAEDGKIQSLNFAVKEMLESLQDESDLRAEIQIAVITFGGKAHVHLPLGPAKAVSWSDFSARGGTPMGAAFDLARNLIEDTALIPSRAYRPTIVLVSDGQPTPPGSEVEPLRRLLESERAAKAFRMALAIGADADHAVLQAFLADPAARVHRAEEARQIRSFFQLVTMSVSSRSRSANPNGVPFAFQDDGWDL
jgi:uncharacterized protein YegL